MPVTFKAGRAGTATIGSATIPITKWNCKYNVGIEETTSSSDYDDATQRTYRSQIDTVDDAEGSIEFNFDAGGTSSALIAQLRTGPVQIALNTDKTTLYMSFKAFLSDVDMTLETVTKITGSASFKSTGIITLPS